LLKQIAKFNARALADFYCIDMQLKNHTLLTSCSWWQPWSHAEGYDPRPRPDWTSQGRDGLPFCVAGPHAPSLPVFRRLLKCELFRRCYGSHLC